MRQDTRSTTIVTGTPGRIALLRKMNDTVSRLALVVNVPSEIILVADSTDAVGKVAAALSGDASLIAMAERADAAESFAVLVATSVCIAILWTIYPEVPMPLLEPPPRGCAYCVVTAANGISVGLARTGPRS